MVVVSQGSFTTATKKRGVTPSTLSKLITRLESPLSVKLFERTTRRLLLTDAGKKNTNNRRSSLRQFNKLLISLV
ncbi:helix-turn-helix domain-containing protein [Psychromonas arctica]|uniref:helix-turn-helix domain-containing protein n=1 Tax=Psychromonas arctica TaxID=168275 RepID=UPI001FDF5948|nr:LysR family transcriptional regulator [Psychromonas arctica]